MDACECWFYMHTLERLGMATIKHTLCVCSRVTLKYVHQQPILASIGVLFTWHVCLHVSQCLLQNLNWPLSICFFFPFACSVVFCCRDAATPVGSFSIYTYNHDGLLGITLDWVAMLRLWSEQSHHGCSQEGGLSIQYIVLLNDNCGEYNIFCDIHVCLTCMQHVYFMYIFTYDYICIYIYIIYIYSCINADICFCTITYQSIYQFRWHRRDFSRQDMR